MKREFVIIPVVIAIAILTTVLINTSYGAYFEGSNTFGDSSNEASGIDSAAFGGFTTAIGEGSAAFGGFTIASGIASAAFGGSTTASGDYSAAFGVTTTASGANSAAFGESTTAQPFTSFVIGQYNEVSGDLNSWVDTDPLFIIGNGDATTANNAVTVLKNGNMGIGISLPNSALDVSEYIELGTSAGVPPSGDCSALDEVGRMKVDSSSSKLYVCTYDDNIFTWMTLQ